MGGALLMDGVRLRDEILAELRAAVTAAGTPPVCLATVVVSDDPIAHVQAGYKHTAAERAGIRWRAVGLPAAVSQDRVRDAVGRLAADPSVHGVFVQLPLPAQVDEPAVLDDVPVDKDVDGLSARSLGCLVRGEHGHVPATPLAVLRLLQRYAVRLVGRRAVVLGRSTRVAVPLALLLARHEVAGRHDVGAAVTIADADTPDVAALCREADLVVSCLDRPRAVTAAWIRAGAAVVDAGAFQTADGQVGDVDFDGVQALAGAVTPSPGGVGPATVACLLANTVAAARRQGAFPVEGA